MRENPINDFTIEYHERVVTVNLPDLRGPAALNEQMLAEVLDVIRLLDDDPDVGCFIIAGRQTLSSANADSHGLTVRTAVQGKGRDCGAPWEGFGMLRTPKVGAVDGGVLNGGWELAMMCDVVIASESTVFGRLGSTGAAALGADSTKRLARLIGRAKAMDLFLTGRPMGVREAERCGLVSRVVADGRALSAAAQVAATIASYNGAAIKDVREAADRALDSGSRDSALFERGAFRTLLSSDRRQAMGKLPRQRPPHFWS